MRERSATESKNAAKSRQLKLTKTERAEVIRRRLFDAAIQVVGSDGYAGATVARITTIAGVAQGSFYNYFSTRQDLLDQLLPTVGRRMLDFIGTRLKHDISELEREVLRFRGFFDFLLETPEFLRILTEAQVYAPVGYERHIKLVADNYLKALRRGGVGGGKLSDSELEVIVHVFMGARGYLCHRYGYTENNVHSPPEAVITAYEKLLRSGLFP